MKKDKRLDKSLKKLESYNVSSRIKFRAKKTATLGYSIYFDYYTHGRRNYDFLSLYLTGDPVNDNNTLGKALEIRRIKEMNVSHQAAGVKSSEWKRRSDILEYMKAVSKDKNRTWQVAINALAQYQAPPIRFLDVTAKFVEGFRSFLLDNYSQNTAWLYLSIFKTALNMAVREGILMQSPADGISIKKIETEREFLTTEELELLQKTPCQDSEIKRAFLFACYTGLRVSDIILLDWQSIDLQEDTITLRQKKTKEMLYIPLLPKAKDLLGKQGTGLVFKLPTHSWINSKLKAWVRAAGIDKNISFHTARHTFAIMAIDAGVEVAIIQKLLGHTVLATTMVYAKVRDKTLTGAAHKMQAFLDSGK
jgi:integrase